MLTSVQLSQLNRPSVCLSVASLSAMPHGINTHGGGTGGPRLFALGGSGKLAARSAMDRLCARDRATGRFGKERREKRATASMDKPGVAIA
jgi:hypothetical protein